MATAQIQGIVTKKGLESRLMKKKVFYLIIVSFISAFTSAESVFDSNLKKISQNCAKNPSQVADTLKELEVKAQQLSQSFTPQEYEKEIYSGSEPAQYFKLLAPYVHEPDYHDRGLMLCYTIYKEFLAEINNPKNRKQSLQSWVNYHKSHFKNDELPNLMKTLADCFLDEIDITRKVNGLKIETKSK